MLDILKVIPWKNLLFLALMMVLVERLISCAILAKALFGSVLLPHWVLLLLVLAVVFIAAGGYAINDYFDVRIDAVNRPDRLIVTRTLTKQQAMLTHQILTVLGVLMGLVVSYKVRSWSLALIMIFVPGMLWFYSSSYKRQFFLGNLIVALVVALAPLSVAIADTAYLSKQYGEILAYTQLTRQIWSWIGCISLFAFLLTLAREIVKDLQDQEGDREYECHTLPIILGEFWTKTIVATLLLIVGWLLCMWVFSWMPFETSWHSPIVRYACIGLLPPLLIDIYLVVRAQIPSDYRNAQVLLKLIMFSGVVFLFFIHFQF